MIVGTLWESGVLIFLERIEKGVKVRYNKLSDMCNMIKEVQTEEI